MNQMNHTKGPWECYADLPSADANWHIVTGAGRMRVVANVHIEPGNVMDEANASLIAAAPDLLDALKRIVECEKHRAADLRHREAWKLVKFSEGRIAQAEAAIAKATGAAQ